MIRQGDYMPVSKSQKSARDKYDAEHYEYISVKLKKGDKERIKKRAHQLEISVNAYIVKLIEFDIETG
jgi:hypothetical protein